jgi:RNA polymerase sigma-70 factor (ECF subfamily)
MTAPLDQIRASIISMLPRLRRCARTITRSHDDADDLVHIALEHALEQHENRRPDTRFETWMFGILRTAWDELRAAQPGVVAGEVSDATTETQSMHGALAALPEEQRIVIALVLLEGLSYEEASEVLDVPLDRVTSWLARGREALQAHL